jgi:hypothetical protein
MSTRKMRTLITNILIRDPEESYLHIYCLTLHIVLSYPEGLLIHLGLAIYIKQ